MAKRKKIATDLATQVLTQAGYRCAVPTCRGILAIDLHHLVEVKDGGGNFLDNLVALCPTCHALHHRGTIRRESLFAWKATLVSLSQAFDVAAVDQLLFVALPATASLTISGDGVLQYARLVAAGMVGYRSAGSGYQLLLTERGEQFISAWQSGSQDLVSESLDRSPPPDLGLFIQRWLHLEQVLRRKAPPPHPGQYVTVLALLRQLGEVGLVYPNEEEAIRRIQVIRNKVVHGIAEDPGLVTAILVEEVEALIATIDSRPGH